MGVLLIICLIVLAVFVFGDESSQKRGQIENIQVQCPQCNHVFWHKVDQNKTRRYSRSGAVAGGMLGLGEGSKVGIAGSFGGINGAIPAAIVFAAVGAVVGHLAANKFKGEFPCPKCSSILRH